MAEKLDRDQLILLVKRIVSGEGTEDEQGEWLTLVQQSVRAPSDFVYGLLFWPQDYGYNDPPSSAEIVKIVDRALNYHPIRL